MGGSEFIAVFLLIIITVGGGYFLKTLLKKYHSIDKQPSRRTQYNSNSDNGPKKKTKSQEKDYSELNKEIEEVTNWIGVSEAVNTSEMFDKVADGKEEEVINEIARQLSMPMKITLKHMSERKHNEDGSYSLAEVIVGNIPRYGSDRLKGYSCTIMLYPGYNSRPDRFIYVIAHELCHYVLQSIRPRLADNQKEERQTDLAVIFSGFKSAYKTGWQSYVNGSAGYILNEDDIEYICRKYESMLVARRHRCEDIGTEYKELLKNQQDKLLLMEKCKVVLDHPKDILKDDLAAIGRCFSSISEKDIVKVGRLRESLKPFLGNKTRYGSMDDEEKKLEELKNALNNVILPESEDISVLMKYADKYN